MKPLPRSTQTPDEIRARTARQFMRALDKIDQLTEAIEWQHSFIKIHITDKWPKSIQ